MSVIYFDSTDDLSPRVVQKLNHNFRNSGISKHDARRISLNAIDGLSYQDLNDKPQINDIVLVGNLAPTDLGVCPLGQDGIVPVEYLPGDGGGGEVNQNAFSNVKVGATTIVADAEQDTLELVGSNVTLTPDATNGKIIVEITASDVTDALGNTPVARATGDASGNDIASTYATKASPALTGIPTAPTAAAGTNTTQIATTAFVANAIQSVPTSGASIQEATKGSITRSGSAIDTMTRGASLTLDPGTYILFGYWVFNTGSSGARNQQIAIGKSSSDYYIRHRVYAAQSNWGALTTACPVQLTETTTVYVMGSASQAQSSSNLDSSHIWAIKL